ncbi:hypothetical protein G7Y89_g15022 [Cudoniella acicularis]|uniref:Protein kinase domain-containing protein n=1 Tax=Cudoniella acicularis TaxID=354080 RepID=A0A8H4QUX3_9HELO|nr:hypothetical protein G7Y89_g15022 [Cudoniella acicularis]
MRDFMHSPVTPHRYSRYRISIAGTPQEVNVGNGALIESRGSSTPTKRFQRPKPPILTPDYASLPFQPERLSLYKRDLVQASNDNDTQKRKKRSKSFASASKLHKSSTTMPPPRRYSSSSTLSFTPHINILDKLDLTNYGITTVPTTAAALSGIHLGTMIQQARKLGAEEADCYFKQLVRGINYLHGLGIAHRDLKPENILLTTNGLLKIANFSVAECFRDEWEGTGKVKKSNTRCGSLQYMAPEVFVEKSFDPRPVDMWAVGLIYMVMRTGKLLWEFAAEGADDCYDSYLLERMGLWGYRPIENLDNQDCRRVVKSLLDPCSGNRLTSGKVLRSAWCGMIELCEAAMGEGSRQKKYICIQETEHSENLAIGFDGSQLV